MDIVRADMNPDAAERRALDFSLASMLMGYPDGEFEATLQSLGNGLGQHPGAGALVNWLERSGIDSLRAAHIDVFDSGKERASLYETEYGRMRGANKGTELADIAGFYAAFGFAIDGDGAHEMLDHLAVELEFHALMLAKHAHLLRLGDAEGCAIVEDAMKKFLSHHLGAFVQAIGARARVREDEVYGEAVRWVAALVASECVRLSAVPKPLDYYADAERDQEPRCATSLPVIQ